MPEQFDSQIHQTIGSLAAKADQAQKDVAGIRHDVANLQQTVSSIPTAMEEIVSRLLDKRLTTIETNLSDVQSTVTKWKTVLGFLVSIMALGGAAVGYFLNVRKLFGVG